MPTQVSALGFLQLITKMGLKNSFIPLILPSIADVYKRQVHGLAGRSGFIGKVQVVAQFGVLVAVLDEHARNEHAFGPVSYTHLDVYKRQA